MKTAKNIQLIVGVSLLVSACFSTVGLVAGKDKPTLCVGNYQSEADAVKQLARFKKTHSNLDEWKARELKIRRQILTGAGLDPLPKKTPLNPVYGKKAEFKGYSAEPAGCEAVPGLFVYGTLYRAIGRNGPFPAVL